MFRDEPATRRARLPQSWRISAAPQFKISSRNVHRIQASGGVHAMAVTARQFREERTETGWIVAIHIADIAGWWFQCVSIIVCFQKTCFNYIREEDHLEPPTTRISSVEEGSNGFTKPLKVSSQHSQLTSTSGQAQEATGPHGGHLQLSWPMLLS